MEQVKIGNGSIPLRIGNIIDTTVYGGPYRECPNNWNWFGVKMAAEIQMPCEVDIPTEDFNVPEVGDLHIGLMHTLSHLVFNDANVYVGCMGGIGRTGLFLAALAKVQIEYRRLKHRKGRGDDPVKYVRKHFIPHAVETEQQKQFIADLDVTGIAEWLAHTQEVLGMNTGFKAGPVPTRSAFEIEGCFEDEALPPYVKSDWVKENSEIDVSVHGMVERDLDWMDAIDADSLSEAQEGTIEDEQMADLYQTIDELEARMDRIEKDHGFFREELSGLVSYCQTMFDKVLTNTTIFERIKGWLR